MAELTESYFYHDVPEDSMPEIPDFSGFLRFGSMGRLWDRYIGGTPIDYERLFGCGQYATVMSVTAVRERDRQFQVGAGPRSATNKTHEDVVSVPTQRQIPLLASHVMQNSVIQRRSSTELMLEPRWFRYADNEALEAHPLGSMVAGVMASKMGMADMIALQPQHITISLESLTLGMSLIDADPISKTKTIEAIAMLNAAVLLPPDTEPPYPPPAAYAALKWFNVSDFRAGYRSRDAVGMFPEFAAQALGMCVHGVCMYTTDRVLQRGLVLPNAENTELITKYD